MLVRDHTSKVFQPKYKDFCIIGFVGKNQVEVKDNHGHTTKVHRRDVKKIPMTEKLSQIYEEEQIGKTRNGRKGVPDSKMPTLNWTLENQKATPGEETIEEIETHRHLSKIQGTIICIMLFIYSFLSIIRQLVRRRAKTTREIATQLANTSRDIRRSMRATSHNFWKQCEKLHTKNRKQDKLVEQVAGAQGNVGIPNQINQSLKSHHLQGTLDIIPITETTSYIHTANLVN